MPGGFEADYVSIETIIVAGRMTHLAITGRFPLAPPLRETGYFIPSTLGPEQQVAGPRGDRPGAARARRRGRLHAHRGQADERGPARDRDQRSRRRGRSGHARAQQRRRDRDTRDARRARPRPGGGRPRADRQRRLPLLRPATRDGAPRALRRGARAGAGAAGRAERLPPPRPGHRDRRAPRDQSVRLCRCRQGAPITPRWWPSRSFCGAPSRSPTTTTDPHAHAGRRLAFVYHPFSFGVAALAAAAEGLCEMVWVVDSSMADVELMTNLLRRLGRVVDVRGLSEAQAAERIAQQRPDGILALADSLLLWTARVAARLGLPFHSPEVAARLTDKYLQRTALAAAGLPGPAFRALGEPDRRRGLGGARRRDPVSGAAQAPPRRRQQGRRGGGLAAGGARAGGGAGPPRGRAPDRGIPARAPRGCGCGLRRLCLGREHRQRRADQPPRDDRAHAARRALPRERLLRPERARGRGARERVRRRQRGDRSDRRHDRRPAHRDQADPAAVRA